MGDGRVSCHDEGMVGLSPLDHMHVAADTLLLHERKSELKSERKRLPSTPPMTTSPNAGPGASSGASHPPRTPRPSASRSAQSDTPPPLAANRPVLAHANGMHWQLDVLLRKWAGADATRDASRGSYDAQRATNDADSRPTAAPLLPLGARVWPPPPALLAHKVLLLGSSAGACRLSTLGDVLPPAAKRMSLLWVKNQKRLTAARKRKPRGRGIGGSNWTRSGESVSAPARARAGEIFTI